MESRDQQKRPDVIEKRLYHARWENVSGCVDAIDLVADSWADLFDKVFRLGIQIGEDERGKTMSKPKIYSEIRTIQEIAW